MTKKNFYKNPNFIILIIGVFFFTILLINKIKKDNDLYSCGVYTVGKILDIKSMKGGLIYYYEFYADGIYINGDMRSGKLKEIGDNCYVIYNPKKIQENKMLLSLPKVLDSLNISKKSWKELPISIEKELIKKALR